MNEVYKVTYNYKQGVYYVVGDLPNQPLFTGPQHACYDVAWMMNFARRVRTHPEASQATLQSVPAEVTE